MVTPDEVSVILRLHALGWGKKRIGRELGISKNTVCEYLRKGRWVQFAKSKRRRILDGFESWLKERFEQHRGNADVVRQELEKEHSLVVSLRTVERACAPWRREMAAAARATVRFETAPGHQMQVDFGETVVVIGDEKVRVYLFVATLGYSRRGFVRAFRDERQGSWFAGMETAFAHFDGVPVEILLDNPRALVTRHNVLTREVEFNDRFRAFARYWSFQPRACLPCRARTKGKDENGVGYVKKNALAGHQFASWEALQNHLVEWLRGVSDVRIHGTTGERPIERFAAEHPRLQRLAGKPPFQQERELIRRVQADACVEIDTNAYSVPWVLIGETVRVQVSGRQLRVFHGGHKVASHAESAGKRQRILDPVHLRGLLKTTPVHNAHRIASAPTSLQRPLAEYEDLLGGSW